MSKGMEFPNLRRYLSEKNLWRGLDKKPKYELAFLTKADAKDLRDSLEGDLSPENLCCDGEAPASYVLRRSKYLKAVKAELDKAVQAVVSVQK